MKVSIRGKLLGGFAVVLALAAVVGLAGYNGANRMDKMLDALYLSETQGIAHVKQAGIHLMAITRAIRNAILSEDAASIQAAALDAQQNDAKLRTNMAELEKTLDNPEIQKQFRQTMADYEIYKAVADRVLALAGENKKTEAIAQLKEAKATADAAIADMDRLAEMKETEARSAYDESNVLSTQSSELIVGAMGLAILASLGIAFYLGRDFARVSATLVEAADKMAVGDLNRDMSEEKKKAIRGRSDEFGQLGQSFTRMIGYLQEAAGIAQQIASGNLAVAVEPKSDQDELGKALAEMQSQLRDLVGQIQDSAAQVSGASDQLAGAAEQAGSAAGQVTSTIQQVARGTANQASSTTQVTASMDEIARRVADIAAGARSQAAAVDEANQAVTGLQTQLDAAGKATAITATTAERVVKAARASTATVQNTVAGMGAIERSSAQVADRVREMGQRSEEIGKIVVTIQDIADQTNLLALNAAIEAARAGDQGRGFAVVADEVRKLAEKSAGATREIAELVRAVQRNTEEAVRATEEGGSYVNRGVAEARDAGQALEEILVAAQQNSESTAAIQASAASVGALAVRLAEALGRVASVGEKNLAATEEMNGSIGEVAQAIESVAAASEENSASVEEVSATAEELAAQVEEVSASAEELASLAAGLEAAASVFTLTGDARQGAAPHATSPSRAATPARLASPTNGRHAFQPRP